MPEIRFEAKKEWVSVLDGYCAATGKNRTEVINTLLEQWAAAKLHEATLIMRVVADHPTHTDTVRTP